MFALGSETGRLKMKFPQPKTDNREEDKKAGREK